MSRASIRFWFCLSAAVIAAAVADPLVERASNAGWFGSGNFTDHSYLDVFPVTLVGIVLVVVQATFRIRHALSQPRATSRSLLLASDGALDCGHVKLLPCAFAFQLLALYVMETAEQLCVLGHVAGPATWLGGPVLVSLAAHAIVCIAVLSVLASIIRVLARATLHVLRGLRAVRLRAQEFSCSWSPCAFVPLALPLRSLRCIRERAPPLLAA